MKSYSLAAMIALGSMVLMPDPVSGQETTSPGPVPAETTNLIAEGAMLYSANCGRCHNMRSSAERTDAQWRVIVSHMRARANLSRSEAEALRAFLQATNTDPGTTTSSVSAGEPSVATRSRLSVSEVVALLEDLRELEER